MATPRRRNSESEHKNPVPNEAINHFQLQPSRKHDDLQAGSELTFHSAVSAGIASLAGGAESIENKMNPAAIEATHQVISPDKGLNWTEWLTKNGPHLLDDNALDVYGAELIDERDTEFNGTATHGIARSCTSFKYEELKKILSEMPPEQLVATDHDKDLPVHSAIQSWVDQNKISFFIRGDSQQIKTILCAKNNKRKTPIELAFESRHRGTIKLLMNLCVQHDVLSNLTGIKFDNHNDRSNTLLHIAFKEDMWPWFLEIVIDACKQIHQDIIPAIQVLDKEDCTPFQYLMNCIQPYDPSMLPMFKTVLDILKQNKIDINNIFTDSNNRTMLHEVQRKRHSEAINLLENCGHKDTPDGRGIKPSQRAHHIKNFGKKARSRRPSEGLNWTEWLTENFSHLLNDNPLNVYGELINERDREFNGTATHGIARSCTSFKYEEMKKILSEMPPKQLVAIDDDNDLPVHSAIHSWVDQNKISLFIRGNSQQIKTILCARNSKRKTPIELAFKNRHRGAIKLLMNLCVQHNVISNLTGIKFDQGNRSNTLLHIAFKEDMWPWFLEIVIDACKQVHQDIIPAVQVLNKEEYTPFHYLMNCIQPDDPNVLPMLKMVLDILKHNKVDINNIFTDSNNRTMLHEVQRKRHLEAVNLLEDSGHKDVPDRRGIKPSQRVHHIKNFGKKVRSRQPSERIQSESSEIVEQKLQQRPIINVDKAVSDAHDSQRIDPVRCSISLLDHRDSSPTPLSALKSQSQWHITQHPKDVQTKVGEEATFSIVTSSGQFSYNWCLNDQSIPDDNPDYRGARTNKLVVLKPLSKHCGSYKCIATPKKYSDVNIPSNSATLEIDGTKVEIEESKLLGKILKSLQVDDLELDIKKLLNGTSNQTYEELKIILDMREQTSHLSTDLEKKLRARIEDDQIYEDAIKNDDRINLFCLKMLALGPGQIGKSTFLRRLLGVMKWDISEDPDNQPPRSTGLSECKEAFLVYNHESVALSTEQSWDVLEIHKELSALVSLLTSQTKSEKSEIATAEEPENTLPTPGDRSDSVSPNHTSDTAKIATVSTNEKSTYSVSKQSPTTGSCPEIQKLPQSEIDEAYKEFEELRTKLSNSPNDDVESLRTIINIVDVGGQPAFLELLPSLTIGPAMYLVFMKLLWELQTPQDTKCKFQNDKKASICENFKYTPEEVIFTALSCIECFGHSDEEVEKYIEDPANTKKINSLVLIMGTYADDLTSGDKNGEEKAEEIVKETNKQLHAKLETTSFYKNDQIEYHNNKSDDLEVLFPINNKSGGKAEVDKYRRIITDLIESRFRKYNIPARWLMFSICLKILAQKKKRKVIEFTDCVEIGKRFKMNKENVQVALRFLHKYIGLVMYFQKDEKLKLLKDIVICDPQAVFTSISELIFNIYDPPYRNVGSSVILRFRQRGFFCPKDHNIEANVTQENHLPIEKLLPLLEYLNIVVPIVMDSIDGYFLPAVLQAANSEVLNKPLGEANPEKDPEPLCIRFKTGFVPLGFFPALVANLLNANGLDLDLLGKKQNEVIYKNKITFRFLGWYNIVLISRAKYCEFRVSRAPGAVQDEELAKCCPRIKDMLQKSIEDVIDRMRQSSLFHMSQGYNFGFECPRCKKSIGNESVAIFNPKDLKALNKCENCKISVHVTPQMSTWFPKNIAGVADPSVSGDDQKDLGTTTLLVSMKMLKLGVTINEQLLDREIKQRDFAEVAMHFDSVHIYLDSLELTDNEQADVNQAYASSNHEAVIKCLSIWRNHKPSKATFRALIKILLDLRKEKIAIEVCQYLKRKTDV